MKKYTWLLILLVVSFASLMFFQNVVFADEKAIPTPKSVTQELKTPNMDYGEEDKIQFDGVEIEDDELGSGPMYGGGSRPPDKIEPRPVEQSTRKC